MPKSVLYKKLIKLTIKINQTIRGPLDTKASNIRTYRMAPRVLHPQKGLNLRAIDVYFDQLSGIVCTHKLVEIIFWAVFNLFLFIFNVTVDSCGNPGGAHAFPFPLFCQQIKYHVVMIYAFNTICD